MHQIVHECIFSRLNYGCYKAVPCFCGGEINLLCLLNKPVSLPLYSALLDNGCHQLRAAYKIRKHKKAEAISQFVFFVLFISIFNLFVF